jgi:hypothetical protein
MSIVIGLPITSKNRKLIKHNPLPLHHASGTPPALDDRAMKAQTIFRHAKVTGTVLAFVSLLVGAAALVAADFGAPGWVFVPLLLWLATFGLPTTVVVLLLAAVWGTTAPLHGFGLFCLLAAGFAAGAEVILVKGFAYFAGGCHEN